ncbi:DUF3072 domain-containing protein [Pseudonocardia nigra]|uniref:DUF3072 domain-containing protein n=1 Tax=Pseudonocardia nigra TaxID=1921578 RepID=UPI001C5D39A3|nr:DUF3072 domain-containing protein [Pseudonocardia nigra]
MTDDRRTDEPDPAGPAAKDPDQWTTGEEPMTGPQKSYLHTLAQQAGEDPPPDDLSKADASKLIDELQERTGRGQ